MVTLTGLAQAAKIEELCFNEENSKKLLIDLKIGKSTSEELNVCQDTLEVYISLNDNNEDIINNLKKDKIDLLKLSDDYKEKYIKANQETAKVENSKPSRTTWFLVGAGTALLLEVLLLGLTK